MVEKINYWTNSLKFTVIHPATLQRVIKSSFMYHLQNKLLVVS